MNVFVFQFKLKTTVSYTVLISPQINMMQQDNFSGHNANRGLSTV